MYYQIHQMEIYCHWAFANLTGSARSASDKATCFDETQVAKAVRQWLAALQKNRLGFHPN